MRCCQMLYDLHGRRQCPNDAHWHAPSAADEAQTELQSNIRALAWCGLHRLPTDVRTDDLKEPA